MMEWIRIEDKIPPEDEHVLVVCDDGIVIAKWNSWYEHEWRDGYYVRIERKEWSDMCCTNIPITEVTHWMPLPLEPHDA